MRTLPPGSRVGLFIRVSSDGQVKDESPEVHIARNSDYAALHGWSVVAVYRLDAISGASVMDHPETKRMMQDVESDSIDALLFSAVARIGRDLLELLQIEKHLRTHGKHLVSTRRGVIDTSTPEGMDSFVTEGSRAQAERLELSARVKAGLKTRARLGQFTAAKPPYGYRKVALPGSSKAKTLEIDPVEGPIRTLMYSLYLEYRSVMAVASKLNALGYRNRAGKPFMFGHVKRLLLDTSAIGIYYANKGGSQGPKSESEWIEIPCPPLVSKDDWGKCEASLNSSVRPSRKITYQYSGLLFCYCDKKMYVRANFNHKKVKERFHPHYECRACGRKIKITKLDSVIGSIFRGFLLHGLADDAAAVISKLDLRLQALKKQLKQISSAKNRWEDAYASGVIDIQELKAKREPLIQQAKNISKEVRSIESERRTNKDQLVAQSRAAEILQSVAWHELEPLEKHALLREFVLKITLLSETLQIQLLYTPSALQIDSGYAQLRTLTVAHVEPEMAPTDRCVWGYYLRKTRKKRGESAAALAAHFGVTANRLVQWEQLNAVPSAKYIPRIIDYLGFIPWCRTPYAQETLGEAIRAARELCGLNQVALSQLTKVSQAMISALELGQTGMSQKLFDKLENSLKIKAREVFQAYFNITCK
jgi:site-specific DNA recombinase